MSKQTKKATPKATPKAKATPSTKPAPENQDILKHPVKEGEKWLKHLTKGEGAKLHLLYPAVREGKEITLCTEVDCEKNKPQ